MEQELLLGSRVFFSLVAMVVLTLSAKADVNLANPAAVYCVESGGAYEIRDTVSGQTGVCRTAGGQRVDAWQLFRENHEAATRIANPAASFCAENGGTYDLASGSCTLADGKVVDGWNYFREHHKEN